MKHSQACPEWITNDFNMRVYKECLTSFVVRLFFMKVDMSIQFRRCL